MSSSLRSPLLGVKVGDILVLRNDTRRTVIRVDLTGPASDSAKSPSQWLFGNGGKYPERPAWDVVRVERPSDDPDAAWLTGLAKSLKILGDFPSAPRLLRRIAKRLNGGRAVKS